MRHRVASFLCKNKRFAAGGAVALFLAIKAGGAVGQCAAAAAAGGHVSPAAVCVGLVIPGCARGGLVGGRLAAAEKAMGEPVDG